MKYLFHKGILGVIFVCCLSILLSVNAFASGPPPDAPWPMFLHDSSHTGRNALNGPSNGYHLWAFPITAENPSSPAIGSDGVVYVGSDTGLYAINPDSTQKWKFGTTRQISSSPAIDQDGTVYFGCLDSNIYAVKPDGTEKWHVSTGGEVYSSPVIISDGLIVAGSNDGSVYAIDSTADPTGITFKWKYTPTGESDWIYASPAIGPDGTLYIATNRGVLALDISGSTPTRKWFHPVTTQTLKSSPAIGSDGSIYIGTNDHTSDHKPALISLDPKDGTEIWVYTIEGEIRSSPVIGPDGTIYIANVANSSDPINRYLYAIKPNGDKKWSSPTGGDVYDQSPAVDSNGVVYIGCTDNFVHAINPVDGSEIWRFPGQGGNFSSIAIGKDQTLYYVCTGDQGHLYAVGPSSWPMFRNNLFHTGANTNIGPTTNNPKWSVDTTHSGTFYVNPDNNELCSSPAVSASGTVYIGGSSLKAYYPDGTLKWDFNFEGNPFMSSPAIGNNGIIYAADLAGRLYALNPTTGDEITRDAMGIAIYSSPVIGPGGIIYIGSDDGKVHAIDPAYLGVSEMWSTTTGGSVKSSPAIGLDGSIYVGSTDGILYAFDSINGSLNWLYPSSGTLRPIKSSPAVDNKSGYIYFGTDDRVVALKQNGTFCWEFSPTPSETFDSSPAISQDGLMVYIGSTKTGGGEGALYALSAIEDPDPAPRVKWTYPCGPVLSSPVIGADGLIYFGDKTGKIIALKPDGTLGWFYNTIPTDSTFLSSSPAIGMNKTLYIGSYDYSSPGHYNLLAIGLPSGYISLPAASHETPIVNAYRMIGIPVTPADTDTFNSLKTFWGGVYDPGSWRLFAYTGGAFHEISAAGQDSISFGKGWFIISADEQIKIEISGDILETDFSTSVESGYILLACPFQDKSVTWATVVDDNTPLQLGANLYYWNGSGDYVVAPTMEPWKSYFAWVENAGTLMINRDAGAYQLINIRKNASMQRTDASIARSKGRQPPPPLAPGSFIQITSPNANENWIGGEQHQVTWNSIGISPEGFVGAVDIALSSDSGNTFTVLKKHFPNSGSYNWRIPDVIKSSRCLIKITSVLYPCISDVSDTYFSIQ